MESKTTSQNNSVYITAFANQKINGYSIMNHLSLSNQVTPVLFVWKHSSIKMVYVVLKNQTNDHFVQKQFYEMYVAIVVDIPLMRIQSKAMTW